MAGENDQPKNGQDLLEYLASITPDQMGEFKPHAVYNETGDLIEVYFKNERCVSHWINPCLSISYSAENPEKIVGCEIWGIKKMISPDSEESGPEKS